MRIIPGQTKPIAVAMMRFLTFDDREKAATLARLKAWPDGSGPGRLFGPAGSDLTNAPYRSGPSKSWLKIKNPKAPAATRVLDGGNEPFKLSNLATAP